MSSIDQQTNVRAKVCHDLRNIAAAVEGGLVLLEREVRPTTEAHETLVLIRRALHDLRETISHLESRSSR